MAKADGLNQVTPWTCENGHVLGIVQRVSISENGEKHFVSRLMLFRQAINLEFNASVSLADVDVMAAIEGTVLDVKCSVPGCKCLRTWWMGADTLERFITKRKGG